MSDKEWINFTWEDCIARYKSLISRTTSDDFVHICSVHMLKLIEVICADESFPQVRKIITYEMLRLTIQSEQPGEVAISYYDSRYYVSLGNLEQVRVPFDKALETIKLYLERLNTLKDSGITSYQSTYFLGADSENWGQERIQKKYKVMPPEDMFTNFVHDLKLQVAYAQLELDEYINKHKYPNYLITEVINRLETVQTIFKVVEEIDLKHRSKAFLKELDV